MGKYTFVAFVRAHCDRCDQVRGDIRKGHIFTDCFGDEVVMDLCWDCEWDIANGGDPFKDCGEVNMDRWESDYEYDPINTEVPPWRK